MWTRRWASLLAGGVVALAGAAAVPAPAAAAANPDFCPDHYVCVYRNANWSGKIDSWNGDTISARQDFPRNVASSWQNHSGRHWCVRDDRTALPDVQIFVMAAEQSHFQVAASANDRADYAYRC